MTIEKFRGDYFFLSNFYPVEISMGGQVYPTLEHAYQASKTFDIDERMTVQYTPTPGKAKRMSSDLTVRKDWDSVKVSIMRHLLEQKFSKPQLRKMLLETGNKKIVEGNTWGDTFWGICKGKGENVLGKLLMEIREEIKHEAKSG